MDIVTYALSKKYTKESLLGGGAVVGKNVTISSITPIDGGNRVTFSYTLDDGTVKTSAMDVKNGIDGNDGVNGIDGADGADGNGIQSITKINTLNNVDTYRIAFTNGGTFDYDVSNGLNGVQGVQGIKGEKGDQGEQGVQGVQGIKGDKGDDGYPFLIYKEYSDISEFNKNDFPEIGLMFMVKSDSTSSYPVYRYTGDTTTPYSHVTNLEAGQGIKGDKGDKGDTGEQGVAGENGKDGITYTPVIGTVVSGTTASASVTINDDTYTAAFDFVIPKGDKGDAGECIVDDALSDTSTNPVQGNVIKQAIDNKADKTVATTSADGLMSAEDKSKLDAFEITTTGGKLHDKDIATTDLIPTSLPANGGNADTVDNKHYTDFSQNAVLSTIEQVNDPNMESGIYSAENVSMSFSSDVVSNWFMLIVNKHRTSSGYGTQIAIPYDNGEQRGTFYRVCRAGNWGNWIRIADENTITNENLLLNPDFRINQQGKSVYTGTTECWDKWIVNAGWETVRSNDDLAAIFTCVTPQVNSWVVNQNIPNYKDYRGKTVTFSANIVTASTKFSLLINDGVNQLATPLTTGRCSVTYTVSDNATQLQCVICTNTQESKNEQIAVLSTKLELGTIATTFVPPNPSIEIAKVRAVNDDFVNANDRNSIQIPSNVDVPAWIYANGKRYQLYMTNDGNIGLTNVPNGSNDWVWYWFDGINIIARDNSSHRYFICDMINGVFSGWKDIYTSENKPYVTGVVVVDSNGKANVSFGFEPSFVLYEPTSPKSGIFGSVYSATTFNATGFTPSADTYTGGLTGNGFSYIAFK